MRAAPGRRARRCPERLGRESLPTDAGCNRLPRRGRACRPARNRGSRRPGPVRPPAVRVVWRRPGARAAGRRARAVGRREPAAVRRAPARSEVPAGRRRRAAPGPAGRVRGRGLRDAVDTGCVQTGRGGYVARGRAGQRPPHTGHAPRPWVASTRSATAICCSRVASSADGAYSPPPCAAGARAELHTAVVAVAGVDAPVAAGLAAGYLIPFAVGGRGRLAGHGDGAATKHCAGNGDLGDADTGSGGLTVTSTHTRRCIPLSSRACEVSCRVRVGEATRPAWSSKRRRRLHP